MLEHEREELHKRLEARLCDAERHPEKRAEHLDAARQCAHLLGMELSDAQRELLKRYCQTPHMGHRKCLAEHPFDCYACGRLIRKGVPYLAIGDVFGVHLNCAADLFLPLVLSQIHRCSEGQRRARPPRRECS
jgi:hypothetical protein